MRGYKLFLRFDWRKKIMCINSIRAQLHGVITQQRSMHFSVAIVSNQQWQYRGPECEDNFHLRHFAIQPTLLQNCDSARSYVFLTNPPPPPLNPLNAKLNPICYLLALLGAHHFLHVSRIRVKSLTFRLLMSYIYGAPILDVSRSHTTTQHSR